MVHLPYTSHKCEENNSKQIIYTKSKKNYKKMDFSQINNKITSFISFEKEKF